MENQDFHYFIEQVKRKTAIDLSKYKEPQMKRRLTTLFEKRGFSSFQDFFNEMMRNDELFHEFLDRMTINVSEFFRNPNRWEVLGETIIPMLLRDQTSLKVWSAACSTGEEPYTLVLLLTKWFSLSHIRIEATDLDQGAIERAKKGMYTAKSVQDVPSDQLLHYFNKDDLAYLINDEIKRCVNFKQHNLLAEPFKTGYDLILCRNVMIYFTEEAKADLYNRFSQSLRPGGVLFVGSTEQIFNPAQYNLKTIESFFYQRM